jgi:hypothetical protein
MLHRELQKSPSSSKASSLQTKVDLLLSVYTGLRKSANSIKQQKMQLLVGQFIKLSHDLNQSTEFISALNQLAVEKSRVEKVRSWLGKIGQYYKASIKLVSAVKRNAVFQKIRVGIFQIGVPVEVRTPSPPGSALPFIERLMSAPCSKKVSQRFGGSNIEADANLLKRINGTRSGIKVHAEIKLLFYYEINPYGRKPRVMCANKDACYLCDLFFRTHGQFQLLRTFGKLNERWVLPDWLDGIPKGRHYELITMRRQFIQYLDFQIQALTKPRIRRPDPAQSTLCLSANWSRITEISVDKQDAKSRIGILSNDWPIFDRSPLTTNNLESDSEVCNSHPSLPLELN